ncbi:MAG: mandelate racemase/muconate lactonizing enzyme family protein [Rhodospirillaceae bacterium]|nr:mandelate racemase/muconate lactonizing enzyme family protein [Rhodospirillaceae bacterium]
MTEPALPSKIASLDAFHFKVPLETPRINAFGKMTHRPALIIRLRDEDGAEGWGECFSNWPSFAAEHRYNILTEIMRPLLVGQHLETPEKVSAYLAQRTRILRVQSDEQGPFDQAVAAVDIAAWDLASRRAGVPLCQMLGGSGTDIHVPAYASGLAPGTAANTAEKAFGMGLRAFKLKVGFGHDADVAELQKVRDVIGPDSRLMVDVNQSWKIDQVESGIKAFEQFDLGWVEEPIPADSDLKEFAKIAAKSSIPISAGENVRGIENFVELMTTGGVSVIQPDIIKWGGLSGCRAVALEALKRGRRYCPHYLGGGIGLVATAHLLAAVGGDGLLELDATDNPLRELLAQPFPELLNGDFHLTTEPGLGVAPDMKALKPYLISG